jgi:PEP-CTERM motif
MIWLRWKEASVNLDSHLGASMSIAKSLVLAAALSVICLAGICRAGDVESALLVQSGEASVHSNLVPEPSTIVLLGVGAASLFVAKRRFGKK